MKIRKQFGYEMAHIVRNAWSSRCSKNIHGHSYKVELLLESSHSDNGSMVIDFGIVKKYIGPYIDSFDHSLWLYDNFTDRPIIDFCQKNFERVIVTPFSTTAEMQAKLFYTFAFAALNLYQDKFPEHGENHVFVHSVIVHETATGYGEYSYDKHDTFCPTRLQDVNFSPGIKAEWSKEFSELYNELVKVNK